MAGIKQAAKWLQEGKRVRHAAFAADEGFEAYRPYGFITYISGTNAKSIFNARYTDMLEVEDLLADDWEVMA